MKMRFIIGITILFAFVFSGCNTRTKKTESHSNTNAIGDTIAIHTQYAKGFRVLNKNDFQLLQIKDPQNSASSLYEFALIGKGASTTNMPKDIPIVRIPIQKVVCMTSLQVSNFITLGITEKIVGVTSGRHLFDTTLNARIASGACARIGIEGNFDGEVVMNLNPDVILISPFKRGGYDQLLNVGIPLIPHLGYKEETPLGQAEWIRLIGLLTDKSQLADSLFEGIQHRYTDLKTKAQNTTTRPKVFSGEIRGGNWYAVGGDSFLAQMFKDAGADYFLKDDKQSGGVVLDFETVYNAAHDAEYWRIMNSFDGTFSYEALKAQDARYADFDAFKQHHVVYCNMNTTPFYERMPTEPDKMLADFIHIFHPELLPIHEPDYYHILK